MVDTAAPVTDNADMDDILSSIKNTVEEETAKAEDGVLVLDSADVVDALTDAAPAEITEERIDLDAFTESGAVETAQVDAEKNQILNDIVGEAANPPVPEGMAESAGDAPVENAKTLEEQAPEETAAVLDEPSAEAPTDDTGDVDIDALMDGVPADAEASEGASEKESEQEAGGGDVDIDALLDTAPAEPEAKEVDSGDVDIDTLMESSDPAGEKPKEGAEAAPQEDAQADADDVDIDALMGGDAAPEAPVAETSGDDKAEEAANIDVDALMTAGSNEAAAESGEDVAAESAESLEGITEDSAPDMIALAEEETSPEPVIEAAPEMSDKAVQLPAATTPEGLQVAFPSEVLAEALRPLVKNWVDQNLQAIVEAQVKEELARLAGE